MRRAGSARTSKLAAAKGAAVNAATSHRAAAAPGGESQKSPLLAGREGGSRKTAHTLYGNTARPRYDNVRHANVVMIHVPFSFSAQGRPRLLNHSVRSNEAGWKRSHFKARSRKRRCRECSDQPPRCSSARRGESKVSPPRTQPWLNQNLSRSPQGTQLNLV